jgi:hypothetical protein
MTSHAPFDCRPATPAIESDPSKLLVVDLQRIPGLSDLPVGDTGLPGQRLQERFDLRLAEVPPSLARAWVPVEELADPVRIEWTAALLDAQFLQDLKVPLRPAWIRVEHRDPAAGSLLVVAHILYPPTVGYYQYPTGLALCLSAHLLRL